MSRENVEIARRAFDRLAAKDLDGFLATLADDVEWRPAQALRDGKVARMQQIADRGVAFAEAGLDENPATSGGD